jgi:hypothetical protein
MYQLNLILTFGTSHAQGFAMKLPSLSSRSSQIVLMVLTAVGFTQAALATPTGPVYPPPGGVTYAHSGSSGNPGGTTATYSNLNPTDYSDLYWGATAGAGLNGTANPLAFVDVVGNTAIFQGTTSYFDAYGAASGEFLSNVQVQLAITLTSGGTWVTAASLGLSPTVGDLVDITGTGFSVTEQFTANMSEIPDSGLSGFQAINNIEQEPADGGHTSTSLSGGFYSDAPVVASAPDSGGTFALLALSLAGLLALRRRSVAGSV